MKLLSLICLSLLIVSCSTNQTKEKTSSIKKKTVSTIKDSIQVKEVIGKPFFDFDNVTHYQSKAKNSVELLLLEDTVLSHKDSIIALTHCEPQIKTISDTNLISNLINAGFKKHIVKQENLNSLKSIFSLKNKESLWAAACTPIYRDYLIFRNKNHISGIAIICFTCQNHDIIGNKTPTTNFGGKGDFDKLRQLLQNK